MAGFIFGQGTPDTYESLQAKRKAAERLALSASRTPQNVGEGLTALGQAIAYRRLSSQADRGEAAGREAYTGKRQSVLGMLMGGQLAGGPPAMAGGGGVPSVTSAPVTPNPAGLPQSVIDAVDRVAPQHDHAMHAGQSHADWLKYSNQNATRNDPIAPELISALAFLPEMGITMDVISGGQEPAGTPGGSRTGSTRHDHGQSADVDFYMGGRKLDWNNPSDLPVLQQVVARAKANGVTGIGAGDDYMGPGRFHVGFGAPAVWGAGGRSANAPQWLVEAYNGAPAGSAPPAPTGGMGGGAAIPGLLELINDPYAPEGDRMILAQLLQTQMEAMQPPDPMQALDMEYKRAQIDEMRGGGNLPDGYEAKHMTALAGGLVPGTPEYQQFMLGSTEGEEFGLTPIWGRDKDGNPALAQLSKNGVVKQSELPEGWQPDPALNAQMQAEGRAIGAARGEAIAAAPTQIANADAALQGIAELRDHPARAWGTGGTSVFNAIPGTGGMDFNSRVEQLKGGAFLTAIQQLQGMGALSNAEGATATAAVTRLSTALSEEAFLDALDDYETIVKAGRKRAQQRLPGQPTSEAPAGQTFTFNPATGELE